MAAPWNGNRRRRYADRRHQVDTRPDIRADRHAEAEPAEFIWYRGPEGDHAFTRGTVGFLRSACRNVRFTTSLEAIEGTVRPCPDCLVIADLPVAPESETERRAAWGDR